MKKTHKERHLRLPVELDKRLQEEADKLNMKWTQYVVTELTKLMSIKEVGDSLLAEFKKPNIIKMSKEVITGRLD